MKRIFDLIFCFLLVIIFLFPIITISILVVLTSNGPVLYWSDRVGRYNLIFKMPKFRSMKVGTPEVASDLLENPDSHLTPIGSFLRKSSLDELPQLWCIIKGDMSVVGPRPALFNQYDLIYQRKLFGIDLLKPGLTGLAQIKGRDDLLTTEKVNIDLEYLNNSGFWFDLKIVCLTFFKVLSRSGISH